MTSRNRQNPASSNPPDADDGFHDADVIRLWERCSMAPAFARGTTLLAAATGEDEVAVGARTLGLRDCGLLELRRRLIGDVVEARTGCPRCNAQIEARFPLGPLLVQPQQHRRVIDVRFHDFLLRVRAPTVSELELLMSSCCGDEAQLQQAVLDLCLQSCTDAEGLPADVPAGADRIITAALEELDPFAAIRIQLNCPDCDSRFDMPFDPADFLWRELSQLAERLLREVDQIARVYHWSEADILALSPQRRAAYLGMVQS